MHDSNLLLNHAADYSIFIWIKPLACCLQTIEFTGFFQIL